MTETGPIAAIENFIFGRRRWVIAFFVITTVFMLFSAVTRLAIDAGFDKMVPMKHDYMRTYSEHRQEFGGANRVLIALVADGDDIFTPSFFEALRVATDEVFFITGVDRAAVQSVWTPNVRYTEVVEDGVQGGPVIPSDYTPDAIGLAKVRENILKAGIVGRLVANDFSAAIISAQLLESDPETGEKLDLVRVSHDLDDMVRARILDDPAFDGIEVNIIGFAKVVGDIADGTGRVLLFFLVAALITAVLVYLYCQSLRITLIPLLCSLIAVVWQLGSLTLLGYGIDPMGILVPFLVFAIGVSHGVQMISSVGSELFKGANCFDAARISFRRLLVPGGIALASDTIGFITILLIPVRVIQEMAITASLGVAAIILTNLVLLPVLISHLNLGEDYRERLRQRSERLRVIWVRLAGITDRKPAAIMLAIASVLLVFGYWKGSEVKIGDLHKGVPELRAESTYNLDSASITDRFSIGVDIISIIVETPVQGCVQYEVMTAIDEFAWHMRNVEGVQGVITLPMISKIINTGWNEGNLKWRVLSRNEAILVQSGAYVETSTGLLNRNCDVMPVMIFTTDHNAETIENIVAEFKAYVAANPTDGVSIRLANEDDDVKFRLATGNVGVMAVTNEEVSEAQFPILMGVFAAIILLCWVTFRSLRAVLCIVLPLGLVSLLAYALMAILEIGLKVNTLPVVALGVGVGVDYGIYIFSRMQEFLKRGETLHAAFLDTLSVTGNGVVFTAVTLGVGVATWIFSPLKFQADMGILLTFMFLVNMLGAIFLLPALAAWLFPENSRESRVR